jgi:hypothetical protein
MIVFISVAGIFGLLLAATDRHAAPGDWLLPACVVAGFVVTFAFGRALAPRTHVNPIVACAMLGGTVGIMLAVVMLMSALGPDITLLGLICLLVPTIVHGHRLRRSRQWLDAGCCPRCGYDLRASSDRCPECGGPVPDDLLRRRRIRDDIRRAREVAAGGGITSPEPDPQLPVP